MVIWIDPLDGTKGFSEGHTDHVSTMIGVSIGGQSKIGIVSKPFHHQQGALTFLGTLETGLLKAKEYDNGNYFVDVPAFPSVCSDKKGIRGVVCGSLNPNQNQTPMEDVIKMTLPKSVCRVPGSGNKFVHLVDAKSDYYCNLVPGMKYWDTCASDAILQGRLGVLLNAQDKPLNYDTDLTSYTVQEGIIASRGFEFHEMIKGRVEQAANMPFEQVHSMIVEDAQQRKQAKASPLNLVM